MLQRLLMALLIACLALPAAAMPLHGSPASGHDHAAMAHEHHAPVKQQQQDEPATQHDCIGCIAPIDGLPMTVGGDLSPSRQLRPALAPALLAIRAGPETPPTRS